MPPRGASSAHRGVGGARLGEARLPCRRPLSTTIAPLTRRPVKPHLVASTGICAIAALAALFPWLPWPRIVSYASAFILSSAIFVVVAWSLRRASLPRPHLLALVILLFAVRAGFLFVTPVGSDDVYRYLWDGRVQAAGINPYRHAPNAPELESLHSDRLPRLVNHPDLKTPYFPVAQWMFRSAYALGGEAFWPMKLLILVAEALTVIGSVLLLRHLGRPREHALLYAAAPLAIFQFGVDAHVDALGFPFLVFGLLAWLKDRRWSGLLLLALSISVKPVAVVLLPFLFASARGWRERAAVVAIPAGVLVVQFAPYVQDAQVLAGLTRLARNWMFNGSIFRAVLALTGDHRRARVICAGVLAVVLLAMSYRARPADTVTNSVRAVHFLLLFSPVVHPWYVGWLAVLLPFAPLPSGIVFVATVSLASLTVVTYQASGVWVDYPLVRLVEYLPVFALLHKAPWPARESG